MICFWANCSPKAYAMVRIAQYMKDLYVGEAECCVLLSWQAEVVFPLTQGMLATNANARQPES